MPASLDRQEPRGITLPSCLVDAAAASPPLAAGPAPLCCCSTPLPGHCAQAQTRSCCTPCFKGRGWMARWMSPWSGRLPLVRCWCPALHNWRIPTVHMQCAQRHQPAWAHPCCVPGCRPPPSWRSSSREHLLLLLPAMPWRPLSSLPSGCFDPAHPRHAGFVMLMFDAFISHGPLRRRVLRAFGQEHHGAEEKRRFLSQARSCLHSTPASPAPRPTHPLPGRKKLVPSCVAGLLGTLCTLRPPWTRRLLLPMPALAVPPLAAAAGRQAGGHGVPELRHAAGLLLPGRSRAGGGAALHGGHGHQPAHGGDRQRLLPVRHCECPADF